MTHWNIKKVFVLHNGRSLRIGLFDGSFAVEDANTVALFGLAANPRAALGNNANFTAVMVALLKLAGTPAADKLPYLTEPQQPPPAGSSEID
ncbi:hypothetical protein [Candidatus Phyllobacterium onerii]|uniref:hypothetical protein n=1 Tax=Candidatus Phyllobacterium onerii TaxID=3020828 RepID=UPI0023309FAD|nr:hypothetical protein [Phyllobacterium sp. IY22]